MRFAPRGRYSRSEGTQGGLHSAPERPESVSSHRKVAQRVPLRRDKEIADAYLAAGAGIDFEMALSFPRFHSDENDIMEVVGAGILDFTGDRNPCTECSDVGIGAYTAHHQFVTKLHVHEAGRRNLRAILFGVGDVETLIEHMTLPMPAYMLICDDTKEVREAIAVYS